MTKNLLIVESPTKARTLKKYLGSDYQIMASVGHIKDLPNSRLGVDTEKDFHPEYVTIKGKVVIANHSDQQGAIADGSVIEKDLVFG